MMIRHGQYLTSTLSIASVIGLLLLLFPLSTQTSSFSLSLDLNSSPDDQAFQSLDVFPNRTVSIQIFATDIGTASDISLRFEFDPAQVAFEGFVRSNIVSGSSALTSKDFANIGITLSTNSSSSGLIGTIHFCTTEAFSGTAIRLVRARLVRGGQTETVSMDLSVTLRLAKPPSPDFDRDGMVGIPDFLLFVDVFGSGRGQDKYDSKYDLDVDGEIGIPDFLLFVDSFGKVVNREPVFTSVPPVMRSVDENTPSGQVIGAPISATDADDNTLTYRLSGADADSFAIEASTGQIQTRGTYDFEQQNRYPLIVHVSDGEGGEARLAVGIAITDIAEPPEQPAPPSVSAISLTSLTVIWTEPVNTGPEITDYDVQYRQSDSDAFIDAEYEITSVLYDDRKKSMRLTDLSPNTEYDIRVRATNEEGMSAWSKSGKWKTSELSLPPDGGSGGTSQPSSSSVVTIRDANLRAAIETALGKASGASITRNEMATLTVLQAPGAEIGDLAGLQFAINLARLSLDTNSISDISSLSGLTNLTVLSLNENSISNISSLSKLTNLTRLFLGDNSISDISSLSKLTNLTRLRLDQNSISDISSLSKLTNLGSMYLDTNSISDISSLSKLTKLGILSLNDNSISDISSLSKLTKLARLYMDNNSISDLSPLVANTGLGSGHKVYVRDNPLSDTSRNTHIVTLQGRGVTVFYDE